MAGRDRCGMNGGIRRPKVCPATVNVTMPIKWRREKSPLLTQSGHSRTGSPSATNLIMDRHPHDHRSQICLLILGGEGILAYRRRELYGSTVLDVATK